MANSKCARARQIDCLCVCHHIHEDKRGRFAIREAEGEAFDSRRKVRHGVMHRAGSDDGREVFQEKEALHSVEIMITVRTRARVIIDLMSR